MRIVFRADSGAHIGSGHLMRCLTLADELRHRGAEISFVTREHKGHLIDRIENAGYKAYRLSTAAHQAVTPADNYSAWLGVGVEQDANDTLEVIALHKPDLVIVDHYSLDIRWERLIRSVVSRIMVIDDLASRDHDCDLLLDQNYFGQETAQRYQNRVPDGCRLILGPQFALLQAVYHQFRKVLPPHLGVIQRSLVFFGATDPLNQTVQVLKALSHDDFAGLTLDVVIGANHPDPLSIDTQVQNRPNTFLYQNLSSLAGLMVRADLMIGAGGTTTWERMCLGLPAIVVSTAENQQIGMQYLADDKFQIMLPGSNLTTDTDWRLAVDGLLNKSDLINKLVDNAKKLVDGLGANRVARVILGQDKLNLMIRKACRKDENLLFEWVNDPSVRKYSFQQKSISLLEHNRWFSEKINDLDCLILIGQDDSGLPIGQVRFELNRQSAEALIDISLDNAFRGLGYSEILLNKAIKYCQSLEPQCKKLIAEVKFENKASQSLFLKLNFKQPSYVCQNNSQVYFFELMCGL